LINKVRDYFSNTFLAVEIHADRGYIPYFGKRSLDWISKKGSVLFLCFFEA